MCGICGCGETSADTIVDSGAGFTGAGDGAEKHWHVHDDGTRHAHPHGGVAHRHRHGHDEARRSEQGPNPPMELVELERRVLAKNDAGAAANRVFFADRHILALNLMGAPGAGKTALLERTIRDMSGRTSLFVVEGDQATANDGERIRAAGAAAVQINTGAGCHLESDMVARGLAELDPSVGSIVFVENVGNLVCPALFDLGESARVVMLSVTEGDDKPIKYPHMFRAADLILVSKIDLLPHVDFDPARAVAHARMVNPDVSALQVSARTGEGLESWYRWLAARSAAARSQMRCA